MASSTAASTVARRFLGSVFLMFFLVSTLAAASNGQKFVPPPAGSWNSNVTKNPAPEMCFQVQRIRHYCPPYPAISAPPAPPSSSEMEIDPRYGVEKRLVPSGPNPLHN